MRVRNIRWVGVPTTNYEAMLAFLRDTMGLRLNFQEATTAEFSAWEGDEIQVMAPGDPYFEFFSREAKGPVPLFEVDDVHRARAELEAAGIEIVDVREVTAAGSGFTSEHRMATSMRWQVFAATEVQGLLLGTAHRLEELHFEQRRQPAERRGVEAASRVAA